jgi:hypothetical protein
MSGVAITATLNAPVLSTVYEILRWSSLSYGLTMATSLYIMIKN